MQAAAHAHPETAGRCPFHAVDEGLTPAQWLTLPLHRSAYVQRSVGPAGEPLLTLFHRDKEVGFDEPELFAFAEGLTGQEVFRAGEACGWGPGYAWDRIGPLLAQLLEAGVLQAADPQAEAPRVAPGERPAPLPPGPCTRPRDWSDSLALFRELTGRPLDPGHLELVVPVFRVAHIALDADDRQVGEANVFPKSLRLERPTRWRACLYEGTRHQDQRPMNVTALKAMRQHWDVMMAALGPVRAAYLRRFPAAADGWTVGHLERLATAVLALVTHPLVRPVAPVPNGALHPALSSLFRVTDGLRMTLHQMLFVPVGEPVRPPQARVTAAEVLDYAERNHAFHSEHGVCAGPRPMIEEFLAVLVDGAAPANPPATLPPAVQDALDQVEAALDYALHGLRVHATVFSLWPAMARCYQRLEAPVQAWAATGHPTARAWQAWLAPVLLGLQESSYLAHEGWRADREAVYAEMHAQCSAGLGLMPEPLAALLTPAPVADGLETGLARRLPGAPADLPALLADFLRREQALLRAASAAQDQLNRRLGRAPARRAFGADEIDLYHQLQGAAARRVPDLVHELRHLLRARIEIDPERLELHPESVGMVPPSLRATHA